MYGFYKNSGFITYKKGHKSARLLIYALFIFLKVDCKLPKCFFYSTICNRNQTIN